MVIWCADCEHQWNVEGMGHLGLLEMLEIHREVRQALGLPLSQPWQPLSDDNAESHRLKTFR